MIFSKSLPTKNISLKGFTLIETLVGISLFTFVSLVAISTLLATNRLNEKLKATRNVYDNLNFVLDDISREGRQGNNYYCLSPADVSSISTIDFSLPLDCSTAAGASAGTGVVFRPQGTDVNKRYEYYLDPTYTKIVKKTFYIDPTSHYVIPTSVKIEDFTSEKLIVQKFIIQVSGTGEYADGDLNQPQIKVLISGKTRYAPVVSFEVGTSISQRTPDN